MRTLFFSLLLAGGLAVTGSHIASAAPANGLAVSGTEQADSLLLVRDGCGRGRHFSKWRGVCVWNTPPRAYYAPRPYYYAPPVYGYGYGYGYGPRYYGPGYGFYYRGW